MLSVLRQGRYLRLLAVCAVAAVLCGWAGVWQDHRWHGKRDANAELRANSEAAPVPVQQLLTVGRDFPAEQRLTRVTASGTWDRAGERYVRQRQVGDQIGFLVVTPFRTDAGPVLFVVRGWVKATGSATQTPAVAAAPTGEVSLTGRAWPSEPGGLGAADLPKGQIQHVDVAALAADEGVAAYGGYAELIEPNAGLDVVPAPDLSNPAGGAVEWQHLAYVVQWFLFALLALLAPVLLAWLESRDPEHAVRPGARRRPAGSTRG